MRVILLLSLLFVVGCANVPPRECKVMEIQIKENVMWRTYIIKGHDGMPAHEGTVSWNIPAHVDKQLVCP